jgi:hypothetical protein
MLVAPYTARSVNQRIPWVFHKDNFDRGHYIELGYMYPYSYVELPRLAIWQENRDGWPDPGDKVRYTKAEGTIVPGVPIGSWYLNYDPEARAIPGNSNTGGRRILIIKFTTWQVTPGGLVPNMDAHLCQPCP